MTLWANQQGAAEAQRGLSGEEIVRGTAQRQSLPTQCRATMCVFYSVGGVWAQAKRKLAWLQGTVPAPAKCIM